MAICLVIAVCGFAITAAQTQPTLAYIMASPQTFTGTEGFSKLTFQLTYPDSTSVTSTVLRANFASGLQVPINTYFVTLTLYANISATRYSANPALNTWYEVKLTNPAAVEVYSASNLVDSAYAFFDNGTYIGSGYYASADYYMVAKTFSILTTLTTGVWVLDLTVYLL
jgi:hypothetical protein